MSELPPAVDVSFIRLLFPDVVEEQIAWRWAARLAVLIDAGALKLRPETRLIEIMTWAMAARVDTMNFVVVFEPELGMDLTRFLDDYETATFREMVQYCANRFRKQAGRD